MTNVQIANKEAGLKAEEISEKKRANRAQERLKGKEIQQKYYDTTVKGVSKALPGLISAVNDVSWYKKFISLGKAPGVVNFEYPTGIPVLPCKQEGTAEDTHNKIDQGVSGIAVLPLVDTLGNVDDASMNAINTASQQVWAVIRENMGGTIPSSLERSDVMQYILAIIDCYKIIADLTRVYKVLNTPWSTRNKYLNKRLVAALGYNYDNLMNNKVEFLTFINSCYIRLSGLPIPMNIELFKRKVWYPSFIYGDEKAMGDKSQIYAFTPQYYYVYKHKEGILTPKLWYRGPLDNDDQVLKDFDKIKVKVNEMIDALFDNTDVDIIVAMMRKAFGDNLVPKGLSLTGTETIEISVSYEVLNQISCATLGVAPIDPEFLVIGQEQANTGILHQGNISANEGDFKYVDADDIESIVLSTDGVDVAGAPVNNLISQFANFAYLNVDNEHVSSDMVLESSRLTYVAEWRYDKTDGDVAMTVKVCGTEIVNNVHVYTITKSEEAYLDDIELNRVRCYSALEVLDSTNPAVVASAYKFFTSSLSRFERLSQFKYHPILHNINCFVAATAPDVVDNIMIDSMNLAPIGKSMLSTLHRIALYSLYIPK